MGIRTRALGAACASVLAVVGGMWPACSASKNLDGSGGDDGSGAHGASSPGSGGSGGAGGGLSVGPGPGGAGGGTGGECASEDFPAEAENLPADIIIAVDTSGSMDEEAQWAQQNMNAMVQAITQSMIDAHVVMISSTDICVPAPLGSGNCPTDENLPAYRHVPQNVESNDALVVILNTYPQWQPSLRANATKTFVVISDDDSTDMSANTFTTQLLAMDPTFQGFKFDAIYSFEDPVACEAACVPSFCQNCGKCCPSCNPLSAAEGTVYEDLVQQTMGVAGDLCDQNFQPVFDDIATAIVSGSVIPCLYDIPTPPPPEMIDYDKVNVTYQADANSMPEDIYYVPGGLADCGPNGGWYYDDVQAPTQILLCPATCDLVQQSTEGNVKILLGCETLIGPPA
jgi:hypothetical protein